MSPPPHRLSLLVAFSTVFIDLLGFGMVVPLLPVYAKELLGHLTGMEQSLAVGLLLTSYGIMQFLFAPLWGRVSDRVGRRPILILSLAGSACFYALFGLATMWRSVPLMFAARIGGGIAGATIPTAQAYIADVTPRDQRTRGMALIGLAYGLGFTFGPMLGALALTASGDGHLSPWLGFSASALSAAALLLAVLKLAESLDRGAAPPRRTRLDVAALREALAVPSIGLLLATVFTSTFAFAAFEVTLVLALSHFLGVGQDDAKLLWAFAYIGLVQAVVQGGVVRRMARFTPEGRLCLIGVGLAIAGYLGMAAASHPERGGPLPLIVAASMVVSGLGFLYPSVNSLLSRRSDPARQGGVLGFGGGMNSLARIFGSIVAVVIFYQVGQTVPFWVSAGLMGCVLGLVVLAVRAGRDWVEEGMDAAHMLPADQGR